MTCLEDVGMELFVCSLCVPSWLTLLNSRHHRQFWRSQLPLHRLQYIRNPWVADTLASYPGPLRGEEKKAWYPLCAHVHNFPGKLDTLGISPHYVTSRSSGRLGPCAHAVSYALKWSTSSSLILYWDQLTTIQGFYSGNDAFTWLPTGFGEVPILQGFPCCVCVSTGQNSLPQSSVLIVMPPLIFFLHT